MISVQRRPIFVAVFLVLALIASSAIVSARPLLQEATESEDNEVLERTQLESKLFIGDDPDEDGYTGVIPTQGSSAIDFSEADVDASILTEPIDWSTYMLGPQPDEEDGTVTPGSVSVADWSPFRYINVAGATLRPRDSATTWTYPGAGCISATGANDVFNIHLPVPNGSRIDYLRIYYYDTSSGNSTAWVTTYDGAGATADQTSVSSAGNAGYGTQLSAYLGHVVNTADKSYVLNWRSNQIGSTMQLCGLRVAYRDPS